jgi:cobalt/nickel transport system permease protein
MHIPDGYLGPKTFITLYAVTLGVWALMVSKIKERIRTLQLPLISMGGAFSFIIMMINFPVPGGSSMHIIGAGLLALVIGPFPSVLALSVCLAIQAFLFGDGGITALGANCFNMGIAYPLTTYYVNKLLRKIPFLKNYVSYAFAVYAGVAVSALLAGIELGLQPLLEMDQAGNPLYCPYPLQVTVPAMLISHMLFVGPVEVIVSLLSIKFLIKSGMIKGLYE